MKKNVAVLASRLHYYLEECRSKRLPPWLPQLAALALRLLLIVAAEQRAQIESGEAPHHIQGEDPEQMHPEEGEEEERF